MGKQIMTPSMATALLDWIDRVGTFVYSTRWDVFPEPTIADRTGRRRCRRLQEAGYLEADPAEVAEIPAHLRAVAYPSRLRPSDEALALLGRAREQAQPVHAMVDDGCPF